MEETNTPHYRDFFEEVPNKPKKYSCRICKKELSGIKATNLCQHVKNVHTREYNEHMSKFDKKELDVKKLEKIQQYTEIVAINGRAFKYLSDSGFVKSQCNDLAELKKHGVGINLNDTKYTAVKDYISKTALSIKNHIKDETNGVLVSMMLDIATKHYERFLGIDIRFISNGDVTERTIGMVPLIQRHTAEYLANETTKCAEQFGITTKQISSLTTDNGANVIAIVDHFDYMDTDNENNPDNENNNSFNTVGLGEALNEIEEQYANANIEEIQQIANEITNEEAINAILESTENYDELLMNIAGRIHHHSEDTQGVKCGAHVLQLIVRGGIKASNFNFIIILCRKICSLLSTQKYVYEMLHNDVYVIVPHKSNETRWNSDFCMVIYYVLLFLLSQ